MVMTIVSFCRNIVMSGDGNLFFASIGVNPGKSTTICDVAGLDSGIVIVNSCELYYQKPDKYQEHQKIVKSDLDFAYFIVFFCQNRDSLSTILVYLKILYDVSVKSEFCPLTDVTGLLHCYAIPTILKQSLYYLSDNNLST